MTYREIFRAKSIEKKYFYSNLINLTEDKLLIPLLLSIGSLGLIVWISDMLFSFPFNVISSFIIIILLNRWYYVSKKLYFYATNELLNRYYSIYSNEIEIYEKIYNALLNEDYNSKYFITSYESKKNEFINSKNISAFRTIHHNIRDDLYIDQYELLDKILNDSKSSNFDIWYWSWDSRGN